MYVGVASRFVITPNAGKTFLKHTRAIGPR